MMGCERLGQRSLAHPRPGAKAKVRDRFAQPLGARAQALEALDGTLLTEEAVPRFWSSRHLTVRLVEAAGVNAVLSAWSVLRAFQTLVAHLSAAILPSTLWSLPGSRTLHE